MIVFFLLEKHLNKFIHSQIIDKILHFLSHQAGEKHYHPQCSRCARCHGVFGEGQEMFLQGKEILYFCMQQFQELSKYMYLFMK